MTNKAKFGLALVALEQLNIEWLHAPDRVAIGNAYYYDLVEVPIEHTLTRHTDALEKALEAIMDTELGRNFKVPPDAP